MILRVMLLLILIFNMQDWDVSLPIFQNKYSLVVSDSLVASYLLNGDVDDVTGTYDGTIRGAEITADRFSSTKSAFRFDRDSSNLNLGLDFTEVYDSLSISIWLYPYVQCVPSDTLSIDTTLDQYFLSATGIFESTGIFGIWNQGSLLIGQSTATIHTAYNYHAFLEDSTWHHLVINFNRVQEEADVYINNDLAYTLDYVVESTPVLSDSLILGGANFEGGNGFLGKIDDVRFYNRLLSDSDIEDLFDINCPDTLYIPNLVVHSDTFIYARSLIQIDSIQIDTTCDLDLIAPTSQLLDIGGMDIRSKLNVINSDGCNQSISIHDEHVKHRGIYINNFLTDGIIGNEILEDSLIDWCIYQNFNNIYLYNIGSILSSGMEAELDSFVEEANGKSLAVTFVSAGYGTSFNNIIGYHEDYPNIPQGIVSEIEFWNGSGDYDDDYVPWLDKLDTLKFAIPPGDTTSLNPDVFRRFYIGKIKNPGEAPSITIAEDLVMHHDEIFLTNYHSNAYNLSTSTSTNSIRNKLSLLATAGKNLDREVNIVVLFNVRSDSPAPHIWPYCAESDEDHEFLAIYESFYHDFINATDMDNKEFLNLRGYGIYRWTDAVEGRPSVD